VTRDVMSEPGKAAEALADLSRRRLNYDPDEPHLGTEEGGWRIDDYCQPLAREAPGSPTPRGAWEVARSLLCDYEFIDPSIVRAVFDADEPLEGRNMLLELRFWGLRFHVGVRVAQVTRGTRAVGGRQAEVWGWGYRTLEGHLEVGQMDYEVRKWVDTGEVEFRIHAFSRAADIPNRIVRLGFRVFGRREQARFARNACFRMRRLTEAALSSSVSDAHLGRRRGLVVRPSSVGGELAS
jgi:uncharacterized protein (UPF0548 family)